MNQWSLRHTVAVFVFLCSGSVQGYERATHSELSQKALEASAVALDPNMLPNIGLEPLVNKQQFKNTNNENRDIVNLFRDGANFEDGFSPCTDRARNHFFDPTDGRGLHAAVKILDTLPIWYVTGIASPDWALAPRGSQQNPGQRGISANISD